MHPAPFFALFSVFLQQYVAAAPNRMVDERQIGGDLSFCYGENSICAIQNDLYDQCENYQEPYQLQKWYQCICGNGYVSVEQA
jgi:hypothetical protein